MGGNSVLLLSPTSVIHMALKEDPSSELMGRLVDAVKEISGLPECKNVFKKTHGV